MSRDVKCRICEIALTPAERTGNICGICANLDELMSLIKNRCPVCDGPLETDIEKSRMLCWVCNRLRESVKREMAAEIGESS